jgi:hypothetical protein
MTLRTEADQRANVVQVIVDVPHIRTDGHLIVSISSDSGQGVV